MHKLTMTIDPELRIAELLTARLCHELVGPVTAVANGAELLSEDGLEVDREALALISDSARRIASRLQLYRFSYGFGATHAAGPQPGELAARYFETTRVVCRYGETVRALPLADQKLACNLLVFGAETLIHGGHVSVDAATRGFRVEAAGEGVALPREQWQALRLATPVADLTARTVHGYFTGRLAQAEGWRLVDELMPGRLCIEAIGAAR